MAVRAHIWSRPVSFHIVKSVFGQFDARFGQRFPPSTSKVLSLVRDGRVVWCPGIVARANADGLGGRSTLADARKADYVIFTTGDSFSYWMRSDLSIPDVVESLLSQRTGLKVVTLNFSRGTYGVLQMLTLAAEMYPTVKPHLVVVQFTSDYLTRGRCWIREMVVDQCTRYQYSTHTNGLDTP